MKEKKRKEQKRRGEGKKDIDDCASLNPLILTPMSRILMGISSVSSLRACA